MKNIIWLLVLALTACSAKEEEKSALNVQTEALAQLTLIAGDPNYGTVASSKTVIFQIRNLGDSASETPTPLLTGTLSSSFSIIQSTGCAAPLAKNATCAVRVNFNPAGKAGGLYAANLKIGNALTIPLTATVASPPSAQYTIYDGAVALNSTGLNFGNLQGSQVMQKILTVKNTGSVATPALSLNLTNNSFSLSNSTCESKILQAGQSCSFKILFSTAGKTPQVYLSDLLFDNQVFPLAGTVTAPLANDDPNSGVVIETYVNNEALTAEDLNLGILPNNQGVVKVITFKNVGTATSTPMTAALSENGNFFIISNLCQDRILPPGASCSFRLVFSAISKNAGSYNVSLTFPGVELPVIGEVLPTAQCPASTHLEDNTCVANTQSCAVVNGAGQKVWQGSAYGACAPVSCNSGFDLANNQCLVACAGSEHRNSSSFVCEANVIACSIANAQSATQTWNGSAYGSCQVQACNSSFHNESNACVSDTRSCVIAHGQGSQVWQGSAYGACAAVSCDSTYHIESNACLSDTRSCVIANGEGLETWMGSQYSACTAQSCNSAYHLANNQCDLDVIDCTASITNASSATQTWNGSAYAACDLQNCVASYHEESNACANNVQDCSDDIANAATATKTWNGSAYDACVLSSCDSGFMVMGNACQAACSAGQHWNASLNQCQADVVSCVGEVANSTAATKTWNGTAYGACVVTACSSSYSVSPDASACVKPKILFAASEPGYGVEPWISDGTTAGTMRLFDVNSFYNLDSSQSSGVATLARAGFTALGDKVIFSGNDGTTGFEPYIFSRTNPQTVSLLKDIRPGTSDGLPNISNFVVTNNKIFFTANNGTNGNELWISDGTTSGTMMVKDIRPGNQSSDPGGLTVMGNKIYFYATDGTAGIELWTSDGTEAGTYLVKDLNPGSTNSGISTSGYNPNANDAGFLVSNNKFYFWANNPTTGYEPWVSDGTNAGTVSLDVVAGTGGSASIGSGSAFAVLNSGQANEQVFFVSNLKAYTYSPQTQTSTLLKDMGATSATSPQGFTSAGGKVYFWAGTSTTGREPWVSDGTPAGTFTLGDLNPGTNASYYSGSSVVAYNGFVYFVASAGSNGGIEIFRTNGTTASIFMDINPGNANSGAVLSTVLYNNKLIFQTNEGTNGCRLWSSDGTVGGTSVIKSISTGSPSVQDIFFPRGQNAVIYQ